MYVCVCVGGGGAQAHRVRVLVRANKRETEGDGLCEIAEKEREEKRAQMREGASEKEGRNERQIKGTGTNAPRLSLP